MFPWPLNIWEFYATSRVANTCSSSFDGSCAPPSWLCTKRLMRIRSNGAKCEGQSARDKCEGSGIDSGMFIVNGTDGGECGAGRGEAGKGG